MKGIIAAIKPPYVFISLLLYAVCLTQAAVYVGPSFRPAMGASLLLSGWLGVIIDGQFSWLANVFYLVAIIKRKKPKSSLKFAVLALVMAIFLLKKQIMVSEAPTYAGVTAYGLGYFLWVLSFMMLAVGQLLPMLKFNDRSTTIVAISGVVLLAAIFCIQYFKGEHSLYAFKSTRQAAYDKYCALAGQTIYKVVDEPVYGLFFDPNYRVQISGTASVSLSTFSSDNHSIQNGWGPEQFYEEKNTRFVNGVSTGDRAPFLRHNKDGKKDIALEVEQLKSDYVVETTVFDLPRELQLYAGVIEIRDLRDGGVLATATYVFDQIERRYCGYSERNSFGTQQVINAVFPKFRR